MSLLSDRPRCESNLFFSGQNSNIRSSSGWEDEVFLDLNNKLIKVANMRVSLLSVLQRYNIIFEHVPSATGWTHRCTCPFLDHNETRPSFGYNPSDDRFNCFGCNRGGRAVEFIAYMDDKQLPDVARELIGSSMTNDQILNVAEGFDYNRLDNLLFDYADIIRSFKNNNNNSIKAVEYADSVTWNLDVYIRKHAPLGTIVLNDIESRIAKLKEQLLLYKDSDD